MHRCHNTWTTAIAAATVSLLVCTTPPAGLAQGNASFYQPYGFQVPFLNPGEFVLSAEWDQTYRDGAPGSDVVDVGNFRTLKVDWTVALSEVVVGRLGLDFIPRQTWWDRPNQDVVVDHTFRPKFLLVIRPTTTFETYANVEYQYTTLENTVNLGLPPVTITGDEREVRFRAGVNWFGQF